MEVDVYDRWHSALDYHSKSKADRFTGEVDDHLSKFFNHYQPPQHGGAFPVPVLVGSKWLLVFLRVPVTLGTSLKPFFRRAAP